MTNLQDYLEQGTLDVFRLNATDIVEASPLIYATAPKYFDLVFGSRDDALQQLMVWCERRTSEYSLHRSIGLKTERGALIGLLIALGGQEQNDCHKIDIISLINFRSFMNLKSEGDASPKIRLPRIAPEDYYIKIVSVAPRFRNQGLARRLVTIAINQGHDANYRRFRLEVDKDNVPARKLYESFGFSVTGDVSYYPTIQCGMVAMVRYD